MTTHHTFMTYGRSGLLVGILLVSATVLATDGTFQGKIVKPPDQQEVRQGWIFVQGSNQSLRRVDVSHAIIVMGPGVRLQRRRCDSECLAVGQEIRVTADQDSAGEWRAKRIEILRASPGNLNSIRTAAR